MELLIIALAALAAGVAAGLTATKSQLGDRRAVVGAVVSAATAALAVSEAISGTVGDFWTAHPINASLVTGGLLLALTVLVIEAVVDRHIADAEDRRWRSTAQTAAQSLVVTLERTGRAYRDLILESTEAVEAGRSPPKDDFLQLEQTFRAEVLTAHEILTRTPRLHAVYDVALETVEAAAWLTMSRAIWGIGVYEYGKSRANAKSPDEKAKASSLPSDRDYWWEMVIPAWHKFSGTAHELRQRANHDLGARLDGGSVFAIVDPELVRYPLATRP